jgi:DNA-binding IclR family transcriptional regulator
MEKRSDVRSGSQAVERAMSVLDCFADGPRLTLSQVAWRTGIPVSTAHRIMGALVRGGYLEREDSECYRVGGHVVDLVPRHAVADEVAPHLYVLAAGIKITVSFAVIDAFELATLVCARPPVPYCSAQIPSGREPLHATATGKALLAFDHDGPSLSGQLGPLTSYTSRTRTSAADLFADLRLARRNGFALSDEERSEGVREVAVPAFGPDRRLIGAIGVRARSKRMTDELVQSLVPAMRHFATEVTRRLGDEPLVHP